MIIDQKKYDSYKFEVKDKQLQRLPDTIEFCKKCGMSNQRPRNTFTDGVCNACIYAEYKEKIDWGERKVELNGLLGKHRFTDGTFDVVVPASGGKDSLRVAHELRNKGMHPLLVTVAPSLYTDIGFKNYQSMISDGFSGIVVSLNGKIHAKLCRIALELVGDNFLPFIYAQKALPFRIAKQYSIDLIFYGENGEAEYGGSLKNWDKSHESSEDWEEFYQKGAGIDTLLLEGHEMGILSDEDMWQDYSFYRLPCMINNIQMHWWSYYTKWNSRDNVRYARENTSFKPAPERTEGSYTTEFSLDDKTDGIHYYMSLVKFGYGRCLREASADVRNGHLTLKEAEELVQLYDREFPHKHIKETLDYLGLTNEEFWKIVARFK